MHLLAETKVKPVWTPLLNKGKPFPTKKIPVEVWAIGAFQLKGIPGVTKVIHSKVVGDAKPDMLGGERGEGC